jgi:hypothetical protein
VLQTNLEIQLKVIFGERSVMLWPQHLLRRYLNQSEILLTVRKMTHVRIVVAPDRLSR